MHVVPICTTCMPVPLTSKGTGSPRTELIDGYPPLIGASVTYKLRAQSQRLFLLHIPASSHTYSQVPITSARQKRQK